MLRFRIIKRKCGHEWQRERERERQTDGDIQWEMGRERGGNGVRKIWIE
jgi:hypothetical protein